jgi:hypothetical protein
MVRLLAALLFAMGQAVLAGTAPTAAKQATSPSQPGKIRLCDADNPGWCWTYTRNGDHYDGVGDRGGSRTMTLESFTSQSVVMRMTQAGRPGWYSVNSGKMSSEGSSITSGEWSDSNGGKGHITATWEPASTSEPAANSTHSSTAAKKQPAAKPTATRPMMTSSAKSESPKGETPKTEATKAEARKSEATKGEPPAHATVKPAKPAVPAEPAK